MTTHQVSKPTAETEGQTIVPGGARSELDRLRIPLSVAFAFLIGVGTVLWILRQPRSVVEILPPPALHNDLSTSLDASSRTTQRRATVRLNLNIATAAELEALHGIGPVTAQRILEYRSQHGRFVSVDELVQEKLVPRSTFERLRDQLSADPPL